MISNEIKIYKDIVQNTDEWLNLRLGKFTASNASVLLSTRGDKGYKKLIREKVYERYTGELSDAWKGNIYTERGHEFEPEARLDYEFLTGNKLITVGFVELDEWCGCSPDAFEEPNGLVQIKCLDFDAHLEVLEADKISTKHYNQMQFELMVTGREYNIYYGYHPKLPSFIKTVERDEKSISELKEKIEESKKLVLEKLSKLKNVENDI